MKIIRLSTFLDFGGIESKMVNLATHEDIHNEWVFVAIGKGGDAEQKIIKNGKRAIALQLKHKIPSLITVWKLYKFLKKEKPDVLHTSGAEANFFGFIAGKLAGISNIIVEEIGIPAHSSKAKAIFQYIFRNANWAIGESQLVINHITSVFGLDAVKTKVIHNFGVFGYDFSALKRSLDNEVFRIIMISRLEPVKNIEGVIKAISKIKQDNAINLKLEIAGRGQSEDSLKKMVKEMGLENNVSFLGFVSDPYPHLLNANLFILNSFTEGFSNSLLEAMYSKTPVLSTAVGSAPEMIQDTINGFLIAPDNELELRKKMIDVMSYNTEKLKEVGECGYQTVLNNFSLENHIEKLMKLYQS